MTTPFKWDAPEALQSTLTTELDGLTNGTFSAQSSPIDNAADKYEYMLLELILASLSPASGATVDIWIQYAPDGSTYSDTAKPKQLSGLLCTFQLDEAAATAQRVPPKVVSILPWKFKLSARNSAGVTLGGSGNILKTSRFNEAV